MTPLPVEFAFVRLHEEDINEIARQSSMVCELAETNGGAVEAIAHIIVVTFPPVGSRRRFAETLREKLPRVSVVHGAVEAMRGYIGSDTRFQWGSWWPAQSAAIAHLMSLEPGETAENPKENR